MPGLHIRFTDDELAELRRRAEAEGTPVTRLAHDELVAGTARVVHFAQVMALGDEIAEQVAEILKKLAEL
jgi:hypothetical protein